MGRKGNAASAALELLREASQAWHGSSHTSCWYCAVAVSYNCALCARKGCWDQLCFVLLDLASRPIALSGGI